MECWKGRKHVCHFSPVIPPCHDPNTQASVPSPQLAPIVRLPIRRPEVRANDAVTVEGDEITGRWVAEVDTNPSSANFKKVTIIDLSNGQSVPAFRNHHDAVATGLPFDQLFVHAHFLDVDPALRTLLVSGEHTGNLAVVKTNSMTLQNVHAITRLIPNCTPSDLEPHVHGVNIQRTTGTAYVSDEGEHCTYESVTILQPQP